MAAKVVRNIIHIDEGKCDGCGSCVIACAEGALQIIGGKAKLVSDTYCDGLGACIGECPRGAITIEQREASVFDEDAARRHSEAQGHNEEGLPCGCPSTPVGRLERDGLPCGCPSAVVTQFERRGDIEAADAERVRPRSMLTHWPVQLALVPAAAPFLKGADVVLCASCVPFAYADFHRDFIRDRAVLTTCPKLEDAAARQYALNEVVGHADMKSLTVLHMEVPCCFGLSRMAQQAIAASGRDIPYKEVTVGVMGDIKG